MRDGQEGPGFDFIYLPLNSFSPDSAHLAYLTEQDHCVHPVVDGIVCEKTYISTDDLVSFPEFDSNTTLHYFAYNHQPDGSITVVRVGVTIQ